MRRTRTQRRSCGRQRTQRAASATLRSSSSPCSASGCPAIASAGGASRRKASSVCCSAPSTTCTSTRPRSKSCARGRATQTRPVATSRERLPDVAAALSRAAADAMGVLSWVPASNGYRQTMLARGGATGAVLIACIGQTQAHNTELMWRIAAAVRSCRTCSVYSHDCNRPATLRSSCRSWGACCTPASWRGTVGGRGGAVTCAKPGCTANNLGRRRLQACVVCRAVSYCGKECQLQHWKGGHKAECAGLLQARRAGRGAKGSARAQRVSAPTACAAGARVYTPGGSLRRDAGATGLKSELVVSPGGNCEKVR
ncbi:hypothetical protein T492DRAFT_1088756 [Pavlovales sp. CCMP2436]|nr:hypothetical protein T492DRAFT_1088756 [Pavlovales sp. CCMP2436]